MLTKSSRRSMLTGPICSTTPRASPPATAGGAGIPARTTGRSSARSAASPRRPCCGRCIEHPQRSGDPLSLTVNFCAPIAQGPFDLDVRLIKANRSTQHWSVELTQGGADVATFATAVFAGAPSVMVAPAGAASESPAIRAGSALSEAQPEDVVGASNTISALSRASRISAARLMPSLRAHSPNYGSATPSRVRSTYCR